jgi:hypothetical protein
MDFSQRLRSMIAAKRRDDFGGWGYAIAQNLRMLARGDEQQQ